jgi:RNA recognition motif-containing protein
MEENKLFVGNLPWKVRKHHLFELFSKAGEVVDAFVLLDRETKKSRGFAFVTMSGPDEAKRAIEMFEGYEYEGRNLKVNLAQPRDSRSEAR